MHVTRVVARRTDEPMRWRGQQREKNNIPLLSVPSHPILSRPSSLPSPLLPPFPAQHRFRFSRIQVLPPSHLFETTQLFIDRLRERPSISIDHGELCLHKPGSRREGPLRHDRPSDRGGLEEIQAGMQDLVTWCVDIPDP